MDNSDIFSVKIVADSLIDLGLNQYSNNTRLTTFIVKFPRMINAEMLRHRALSFNSASSRAIPIERINSAVRDNPAHPIHWGAAQKGMQAETELDDTDPCWLIPGRTQGTTRDLAKFLWSSARDAALHFSNELNEIGAHKQIANRLTEPFQCITLIISGVFWENFFALRASEYAQPEFKHLAYMMLEEYNKSIPEIKKPITDHQLPYNFAKLPLESLHAPFIDQIPDSVSSEDKIKIAVARCARLSYMTHDNKLDIDADLQLYDRLVTAGHMSPTEHIAAATPGHLYQNSNFGTRWLQFRKMLPHENRSDSRVIRYYVTDNGEVAKQKRCMG